MIGLEFHQVPKGFAQKVVKVQLGDMSSLQARLAWPVGLSFFQPGAQLSSETSQFRVLRIFETLRIIPPLTVSEEECDRGLKILADALEARHLNISQKRLPVMRLQGLHRMISPLLSHAQPEAAGLVQLSEEKRDKRSSQSRLHSVGMPWTARVYLWLGRFIETMELRSASLQASWAPARLPC